ncbi:MAG: DUF1330 domain-containing protein [Tardiphaga sp.]
MKAYVVNEITISDPALYQTYVDPMPQTLLPFGGRFLARGAPEAIAGDVPSPRVVLLEFPDAASARAWRDSESYTRILEIRNRASTSRVYLMSGEQQP